MSRAFVKEDASNEQIIVPARAPLPDDRPNLVTPRGLALLQQEQADLEREHDELQAAALSDAGRARELAVNEERLAMLLDRLASIELVPAPAAPVREVVFGATVTLRTLTGKFADEENRFTVTGVDEADLAGDHVAFTAPLVQAVMGHAVGDEVKLKVGPAEQTLLILSLETPGS